MILALVLIPISSGLAGMRFYGNIIEEVSYGAGSEKAEWSRGMIRRGFSMWAAEMYGIQGVYP